LATIATWRGIACAQAKENGSNTSRSDKLFLERIVKFKEVGGGRASGKGGDAQRVRGKGVA